MIIINIDFAKEIGKIKPMNAVNNGPIKGPRMFPQSGNFLLYQAAKIPYARNHDAAFVPAYGGEHTVDINAIFPNFDADPDDPASYDFICTDHYIKTTTEAGTKTFYRLGNKIDHRVKKYDSIPPKDFHKWAVICEHIIRHYTEGWADGFFWDIEYWEIWNEPENRPECWDGTLDEFFEFFAIAAKHLKTQFPHLKIGGPSFASNGPTKLVRPFLNYMREHEVPVDFFSWHCYKPDPKIFAQNMRSAREGMDECGYTEAESILNEYTYIINWKDGLLESKKAIISIKGAAFVAAVMLTGQNEPLDMLMYYTANPSALNCLFNYYTHEAMKGYYPFYFFSKLNDLGTQVECTCVDPDLYMVAAKGAGGKGMMLSYFTNEENAPVKEILLKTEDQQTWKCSLVDTDHDGDQVDMLKNTENGIAFQLKPNTFVYLETV